MDAEKNIRAFLAIEPSAEVLAAVSRLSVDGSMVIVENARKHIGETLDIVVTSALQTSAGRLVFAKFWSVV